MGKVQYLNINLTSNSPAEGKMMKGFEQILKELEDLGRELDSVQKEMTGLLVRKISGMERIALMASSGIRENELIFEREIQRITLKQRGFIESTFQQ
jgi:hypothetical protein